MSVAYGLLGDMVVLIVSLSLPLGVVVEKKKVAVVALDFADSAVVAIVPPVSVESD